MVKFTVDRVRELMDQQKNIRNVTVIAHVDHGKSTLTDTLIAAAGIIAHQDIGKRITDTHPEEQLKGITIKSTGITLYFETNNQEYLINLIDSPGHVDFSSEVTAALRLTDGALVLVDCVEGCSVQTETVLRQSLSERIKPVLAINKLDRAFLELQMDAEKIYQNLFKAVTDVNIIIGSAPDELMGDVTVYPEKGTVAFTAGKQGWGFTLNQFAKMYSKKLGIDEDKLVNRLWGDNYYDPEAKKWTTSSISATGKPLTRAFCKFIIEPIQKVFDVCLDDTKRGDLDKLLTAMNVQLTIDEKKLLGKDLAKLVLQRWLPASDALLEMISTHLPSPAAAQKYRVENLYTGPQDDETAAAIRACDPKGPLVVYISKMVPNNDRSRFFAFGRVFSGTVSQGQKVHILGPNYTAGKKEDLFEHVTVQRVVVMMGKKTEAVESVPCGNTAALVGIDTYLSKSCTLVTDLNSHPLVNMKFSVAPVVRVAVSPKNMAELPKLVEGMKRLSKADPLVQCVVENTGEHLICCAGDLHLEICLKDLKDYMGGSELVVSEPVVAFKETITSQSEVALAKSPNNMNRLYVFAEPMSDELTKKLEEGLHKEEAKSRARILVNDFGWNVTDARRIWTFSSESYTNTIVDCTKGIAYLNEIKDSVVAALNWVSKEGVIAEEPLRGVRFNLVDAMLHSDSIHRGGGQIIPAARRVFYASQLMGKPSLMEPVYQVEIQCPSSAMSGIYQVLNQRRGLITETSQKTASFYTVKAYLPVQESFGFTEHLRSQTSGQAFPQCAFSHYQLVAGDVLDTTSKAYELVLSIRKRKGLNPEIPSLAKYLDKL
eukprot:TRINITY_DN67_c0_g1_i3.p1 TRINITY_DN67_c0_g1~~TRINITY_DN67_c0_g1_i3.p1  ORF type:complete len:827 (+),score=276.60 TRINITY_DN67_c0_g1_i3:270-2750(+)